MKILERVKDIKTSSILLNIILVVVISFVGLIIYWSIRPYDIVQWKIDQYQTTKQEYKVGEVLTYRTAFCKRGNYIAHQMRRLEDGVVYLFPDLSSSTTEGCLDFISTSTTVPNVPTGEYFFEIEFIYKVNPIREVRYTMHSNRFKIVNDNNF